MTTGARGAVLALDPGTVRIGIAVSDAERRMAFPLTVVPAKAAFEEIRKIVAEREIRHFVVGMPMTLRGEIGPEGARVERFIEKLVAAFPEIEIATVDERLSSSEAEHYLTSGAKRGMRDAVAASVMLERYLGVLSRK